MGSRDCGRLTVLAAHPFRSGLPVCSRWGVPKGLSDAELGAVRAIERDDGADDDLDAFSQAPTMPGRCGKRGSSEQGPAGSRVRPTSLLSAVDVRAGCRPTVLRWPLLAFAVTTHYSECRTSSSPMGMTGRCCEGLSEERGLSTT